AHLRDCLTVETGIGIVNSLRHRAKPRRHFLHQRVMSEISRDRYDHPARLIARFEKLNDVLSLKIVDGFLATANRPADWMVIEEIMHVVVGSVFRLRNFLQDDRALSLDLLRVEARV